MIKNDKFGRRLGYIVSFKMSTNDNFGHTLGNVVPLKGGFK